MSDPTAETTNATPVTRTTALLWKVVAAAVALAALGTSTMSIVNWLSRTERTERRAIDATPVRLVEIHTDSGSVRVSGRQQPEGARTVDLTAHLVDGLVDSSFSHRVVGDRLVVELSCAAFWIGFNDCDLELEVLMPSSTRLVVTTDNGDVTVSDVDGGVRAESDNGTITAADAGGRAEFVTSNGDITASGHRGGRVRAVTDNGDVSLAFDDPPTAVRASSDNGDVEVVVPRDGTAYALSTDTDNGEVDTPIATDPASDRTVDVSSSNGDLTVRY